MQARSRATSGTTWPPPPGQRWPPTVHRGHVGGGFRCSSAPPSMSESPTVAPVLPHSARAALSARPPSMLQPPAGPALPGSATPSPRRHAQGVVYKAHVALVPPWQSALSDAKGSCERPMSAADARRAIDLERTLHPPRPMAGILAAKPRPPSAFDSLRLPQHPSALVPSLPSARPSSNRAYGARTVTAEAIERSFQPPRPTSPLGVGRGGSAGRGTQQRELHAMHACTHAETWMRTNMHACTHMHAWAHACVGTCTRACMHACCTRDTTGELRLPMSVMSSVTAPSMETQQAAWGEFRTHVYRRLATPNDVPPPPEPVR